MCYFVFWLLSGSIVVLCNRYCVFDGMNVILLLVVIDVSIDCMFFVCCIMCGMKCCVMYYWLICVVSLGLCVCCSVMKLILLSMLRLVGMCLKLRCGGIVSVSVLLIILNDDKFLLEGRCRKLVLSLLVCSWCVCLDDDRLFSVIVIFGL